MIKFYEKLFPYEYFTSRETIIKKEKCSICGEIVGIRSKCKHKPGKLYMGEMCGREVIDFEIIGLALVKDPFDKYAVIHIDGMEYNYEMLELLEKNLKSPYDYWYVKETKELKSEYVDIGRNKKCPCKSGKKYKQCCMGTENIYRNHIQINLLNQPARNIQDTKTTSRWKK